VSDCFFFSKNIYILTTAEIDNGIETSIYNLNKGCILCFLKKSCVSVCEFSSKNCSKIQILGTLFSRSRIINFLFFLINTMNYHHY
jgi:hypothetical protein